MKIFFLEDLDAFKPVIETVACPVPLEFPFMPDSKVKEFKDMMKGRFKSVRFIFHKKSIFVFSDPSDEAFFLLWSANGIEI